MRAPISSLFAGLAGLLASVGCSHLPLNPAYQGPRPRSADFLARFQCAPLPEGPVSDRLVEDGSEYRVREMMVRMENRYATHLNIRFYEQRGDGKFPLLVISTILNDPADVLARLVANYFARRGYNCAIISRGTKKLDVDVPLGEMDEWQRAMLCDYAAAKQVLTREPKVDPHRLATYGISYGAINNTVLAGVDDSYRAHVIALAGGPLSEVLPRSHEVRVRKFLREYCEKHQCTREQFIAECAKVETDPLKMAPYIDARKVLLALSRFDLIVPYENGHKLRDAMGGPQTLVMFAGHYTAIPYLGYMVPQSRKFLDAKLGVKR
jgi:hypothetical protein